MSTDIPGPSPADGKYQPPEGIDAGDATPNDRGRAEDGTTASDAALEATSIGSTVHGDALPEGEAALFNAALSYAGELGGNVLQGKVEQQLDKALMAEDDTPPPANASFFDAVADDLKDRVIAKLRDDAGSGLCGSATAGSESPEADAADAGFWSGVCGGWIGRPVTPSGLYGYLHDHVVGGFNTLFDIATRQLGLMPDEP